MTIWKYFIEGSKHIITSLCTNILFIPIWILLYSIFFLFNNTNKIISITTIIIMGIFVLPIYIILLGYIRTKFKKKIN